MARRKKTKEFSWPIAIVIAIVLVGSLVLILRPVPEQVFAQSTDGHVRMEGVTRNLATPIEIERLDGVQSSVEELLGPVYEIRLESGFVDRVDLEFDFELASDDELSLQEVLIYFFDRETLTWQPMDTFFDLDREILTTSTTISDNLLVALGHR